MGHLHYNSERKKNKHLEYSERLRIKVLYKEGKSTKEISKALGCSQRTIQRELKRGQVVLVTPLWEEYSSYGAEIAQNKYEDVMEGKGPTLSRNKLKTKVYYAHPYSTYERGTNENMNRMIRRFIPKGADISKYTHKEINRIENWLNNYPRKILGYKTSLEIYTEVA